MAIQPLNCTKCQTPISPAFYSPTKSTLCPKCLSPLQLVAFPALFNPPAGNPAMRSMGVEGEATCFFHPSKIAERICDSCGRFVCAICDIELSGRHLCPSCIESGKRKGKVANLQNSRTLWDKIAMYLTVLPVLFIWPTFLTAPAGLFVCLRYWNSPRSLVRPSRSRFIVSALFAIVQIAIWTMVIIGIVQNVD